jgi:hypothetical protein
MELFSLHNDKLISKGIFNVNDGATIVYSFMFPEFSVDLTNLFKD